MTRRRERAQSFLLRVREWILLDGHRDAIAVGLLVVAFVLLAWLSLAGVVDVARDRTSLHYLFEMLGGGNFTLVTIVISINQLILSRELRTPGELQSEQEAASEYRAEVESEVDRSVVPQSAENFLVVLVGDTRELIDQLDAEIDDVEDPELEDDAAGLLSTLGEELDDAMALLEESNVGVFRALSSILDADFAGAVNHSRWLRTAHGDDLPDSLEACLHDLEDRLGQLNVARQYYKTIYVQRELADLSRIVLLTGLVAMGASIAFLATVGSLAALPQSPARSLVVPLAVTLGLGPLAVLLTHVLRVATVARRTAAISPFVP